MRLGLGLDRVSRQIEAGRVNELDDHSTHVASRGEIIAGRPGAGRDNRPVVPRERVEQPALARVGRTRHHNPGVPRRPVAPGEAISQCRQRLSRRLKLVGQRRAAKRVDVGLVGEIEVCLEMSHQVEQAVSQVVDWPGQPARQLPQSGVELGRVAGVDHAQDRFGTGQVDPTGEKRAKSELARPGVPGPAVQTAGQYLRQQRKRAHRMDLGDVLAGVSPRARPECDDRRQERPQTLNRKRSRGGPRGGGAATESRSDRKPSRAIRQAFRPEIRTSPRTPGPGGLATAAIVSSGSRSASTGRWLQRVRYESDSYGPPQFGPGASSGGSRCSEPIR